MKFPLPSLFSGFFSKSDDQRQTTTIVGDNNKVFQQQIVINTGPDTKLHEEWRAKGLPGTATAISTDFDLTGGGDDLEEIKRIIEYRQIATNGDSATALALFEKLKSDPRFQTGSVAFRLHFNIGIVQQNIGELALASASLKHAYAFCPDDPKAKAGFALAHLNENCFPEALDFASCALLADGDHQQLAAVVGFHAAKRLVADFDVDLKNRAVTWSPRSFGGTAGISRSSEAGSVRTRA